MQVHSLEPQLSHLRSASTPRTIGPPLLSSLNPPPLFARLKAAPRSIDDEILGVVASVKFRIRIVIRVWMFLQVEERLMNGREKLEKKIVR